MNNLMDKSINKVYIKNNKRKMMSSDGFMMMNQSTAKKNFGKMQGGKYSVPMETMAPLKNRERKVKMKDYIPGEEGNRKFKPHDIGLTDSPSIKKKKYAK